MNHVAPIIEQLIAARTASHLTQRALEARAGFARGQINEWECGRVRPTLPNLELWAAAVGSRVALVNRDRRVRITSRDRKDLNKRRAAAALTPDAPILGGTK